MNEQQLERIQNHPDFRVLVTKKNRLGWSLTAIMLVLYYGFILLLAFSPATLGQRLGDGVTTLGMPVGVAIIVAAFALTGVYVRRANAELDPLNDKIVEECRA
ncbi:DUF485 domain-containing protein [Crenobacter luteus]|uniref:DUF485 domain-containing protein n=1 Tax=Crenobacter luteus TaxID=1452487 RepID=A0A165ENU5_9NEIS|nr:DUF485 domain-containing protein [Crenobacter luteus]KZE27317.1 hypothetical protein AVW16_01855 [Crenobacter luteus]